MRIAILDPAAGISGDMTLGALLSLGVPVSWLEELPKRLGLDGVVTLTGRRQDAVAIVAAADAFAMTSASEGLGLVVLEAMAVGCPVVATAVGGVLDIVRDDETGLLVPDGDARALAEALGRLLDDPTLRRRLAGQARRLAEREFSVKGMVEQYEAVYESVVARRRAELSPRRV